MPREEGGENEAVAAVGVEGGRIASGLFVHTSLQTRLLPLSTETKKQTASGWQDRDVGVKKAKRLLGSCSPGASKEREMPKRRVPRLGREVVSAWCFHRRWPSFNVSSIFSPSSLNC